MVSASKRPMLSTKPRGAMTWMLVYGRSQSKTRKRVDCYPHFLNHSCCSFFGTWDATEKFFLTQRCSTNKNLSKNPNMTTYDLAISLSYITCHKNGQTYTKMDQSSWWLYGEHLWKKKPMKTAGPWAHLSRPRRWGPRSWKQTFF